ncbi:MAG: DUF3365 domain-containing protein [Candidatus Omnitrophota bacterium]|jgi:hypothetical protein|nr:MAG: DUF3365 domain-containing protein [Candidatus Omnitrophota bacterium]
MKKVQTRNLLNRGFQCVLLGIIVFLCGCGEKKSQEEINQELLAKSKRIAQEFGGELKRELQTALQTSGPAGAIEVCKNVSVKTEQTYQQSDPNILRLRRISLKTRNTPHHTPTAAEKQWLEETQLVMNGGTAPVAGILADEEKYTVLLPIVIEEGVCLMCHGGEEMLDEQLKQALQTYYPDDQAIGYQIGDLRGAIAVEWKK